MLHEIPEWNDKLLLRLSRWRWIGKICEVVNVVLGIEFVIVCIGCSGNLLKDYIDSLYLTWHLNY